MKTTMIDSPRVWIWLCFVIWPAQFAAAQFVDLQTEVEVTDWYPKGIKTWTTAIHCVVGTNSWEMDGAFLQNATVTYRFTGTNLTEESVITKALPKELMKRLNRPGMPFGTAPAVGSRNSRQVESVDGNPGRTVRQSDQMTMVARIAWLAFCSGPCLKGEGRLIYPPNDLWKEMVSATSFKDRTAVFDDELGLPRSMDLSTSNNQQVMQYRVASSTNYVGWEFPQEFYLAQYRKAAVPEKQWMIAGTNGWELDFVAKGTVKAIAERAELPSAEGAEDHATPGSK
jgi:hypothetical protein